MKPPRARLGHVVELLHSVGFGHGHAVKRRENKTSRKASVRLTLRETSQRLGGALARPYQAT